MRLLQLCLHAWIITLGLLLGVAQAETFPSKPLKMIVAWPAGGGSDFLGRLLAKEMSESLGQTIIVENIPGASGSLGTGKAMREPADGYTLMLSSPLDMILSPLEIASVTYKSEDARAIIIAARADLMLAIRKELPASNVAELIKLMKAHADAPLTYCSAGVGSLYHLVAERFNTVAGVRSVHVPYLGLAPCLYDLAGGRVDFSFLPLNSSTDEFVDNGGIKALAMVSDAPSPRFPGLPLASATKGLESFSFPPVWGGLHVRANVPDAVAEVLNKHANAAIAKPDVRKAIEQTGALAAPPQTLKQAQDDYLGQIRLYTDLARAVGQPRR